MFGFGEKPAADVEKDSEQSLLFPLPERGSKSPHSGVKRFPTTRDVLKQRVVDVYEDGLIHYKNKIGSPDGSLSGRRNLSWVIDGYNLLDKIYPHAAWKPLKINYLNVLFIMVCNHSVQNVQNTIQSKIQSRCYFALF